MVEGSAREIDFMAQKTFSCHGSKGGTYFLEGPAQDDTWPWPSLGIDDWAPYSAKTAVSLMKFGYVVQGLTRFRQRVNCGYRKYRERGIFRTKYQEEDRFTTESCIAKRVEAARALCGMIAGRCGALSCSVGVLEACAAPERSKGDSSLVYVPYSVEVEFALDEQSSANEEWSRLRALVDERADSYLVNKLVPTFALSYIEYYLTRKSVESVCLDSRRDGDYHWNVKLPEDYVPLTEDALIVLAASISRQTGQAIRPHMIASRMDGGGLSEILFQPARTAEPYKPMPAKPAKKPFL